MLARLGSLWKRTPAQESQDESSSESTASCEIDKEESSSRLAALCKTPESKLSRFVSLPNEIQQEVMWQCGSSDLVNLACTSSEIQKNCLQVLYHNVDISYHNDSGLFPHWRPSEGMVLGNNPNRQIHQDSPLSNNLKRRQERFIFTILSHPSLGALVRTLTWTYQWYWENPYITSANQQKMWAAFLLLTRVEDLDICSFNTEEQLVTPPPLFPTASSVRIGGKMPYLFFRSFLSNPANITSLDSDNPQGFFQLKNGFHESAYPRAHALLPETEGEDGYPLVRHYGPMRGHLRPLFNRFEKLQNLSIRTVGQDDSTDRHYLATREKSRYEEIAAFISSTANTLETLLFEQGIIQEGDLTGTTTFYDPRRVRQVGRPMDKYFLEHIHPILLSTEWKKLKKVSIHGVGGKPRGLNGWRTPQVGFRTWEQYDPVMLEAAEDSLRMSLGEGVHLEWEAEVGRTFYLHEGSNYADRGSLFDIWGF